MVLEARVADGTLGTAAERADPIEVCGSCRSRGRTERAHRSLENAQNAFPTAPTRRPQIT